ncbi:MAG: hypothetical protein SNJ73_09555 [Acetobacteraceae bacterium]
MADQAGATMDDPEQQAFLRTREAMYGRFVSGLTWATGGVAVLLILLAIFLV